MNLDSMFSNVESSQAMTIVAQKSNFFENARKVFLSTRQEMLFRSALPLSRTIKIADSGALVTVFCCPFENIEVKT